MVCFAALIHSVLLSKQGRQGHLCMGERLIAIEGDAAHQLVSPLWFRSEFQGNFEAQEIANRLGTVEDFSHRSINCTTDCDTFPLLVRQRCMTPALET